MKKLIAITALLFMVPMLASAQGELHPYRGQGYLFVGEGTHQMGLTAGFGGEGYFYKGLGAGAELEATGMGGTTNVNSSLIGVGSADLSYHFFPKKNHLYPSPFVAGGYSILFGHDNWIQPPLVTARHYASGFNVGVGLDYFATRHLGMRFDVRYYGHGGILWASFPNLAQFSFTVFRIAFTFR